MRRRFSRPVSSSSTVADWAVRPIRCRTASGFLATSNPATCAVPLVGTDAVMETHARKFAAVKSCAGNDFNRGLRAYYFGMAVMAWMVSAWLFILSTFIIVFVMARREFASPVFKALSEFAED